MRTDEEIQKMLDNLGISEDDIIIETGNYNTGFWHNELSIDLEDFKNGKMSAFSVILDIHDTSGMSFREYYGIDKNSKLPSGVKTHSLAFFCLDLLERYETLTKGLEIEWDNGNDKAKWYDEDGDLCAPNDYWGQQFQEEVREIDAREVYDLSFSENYPFVKEVIEPIPNEVDVTDVYAIEQYIKSIAYNDDNDFIYTGHYEFARRYVDEDK
jgi:hypothetical protein